MKKEELLKRAEARVKNGKWIIKQCPSSNIKEWERELEFSEEIVAIIKNQPTITEQWIEEKARKMQEITATLFRKTGTMNYPLGRCRDFIRKLVEEMGK